MPIHTHTLSLLVSNNALLSFTLLKETIKTQRNPGNFFNKMRNTGPLLFLIWFALLVSHPVSARSSKSEHVMVFSGTGWESVVKSKPAELRNALITDITSQLIRRYAFDTIITIDSLKTSGNLQVGVSVNQTVLKDNADAALQHVWPADEANSMITQGAYRKTLALYSGPGTASLISIQVPTLFGKVNECDALCVRLIAMGIVMTVIMGVTMLLVILWVCCHWCCCKSDKEDVLTGDNPFK
ncbi:uncharacterized protein TM35_000292020 [Trypanosoma theileri]|uniref:Uncharacterized protein n=1 Tax=Trypanosoma theileri TaxID=67003 RepID=A0A1X0NQA7_9TRYP|nr:uncharacterized protein TM35_000292020 [Trypanosoma theileri]ORC86320.1 hypothetical protein TM35_000292020 [Trypanosoma theileri]